MSKRSSRRRRDAYDIANHRLRTPKDTSSFGLAPRQRRFFDIKIQDDRRRFDPEGIYRPARSISTGGIVRSRVSRVTPRLNRDQFSALRSFPTTKAIQVFERPDDVLVCVRRSRRREVLHALGKAGRGGNRPPRYNRVSKISCKR